MAGVVDIENLRSPKGKYTLKATEDGFENEFFLHENDIGAHKGVIFGRMVNERIKGVVIGFECSVDVDITQEGYLVARVRTGPGREGSGFIKTRGRGPVIDSIVIPSNPEPMHILALGGEDEI